MNKQPTLLATIHNRLREAAIPLMDGESVGQFADALSSAAKGFVRGALGIDEDVDSENYAWVWTCDLMAETVVVEVEYRDVRGCHYYAVPWIRAENGDFGFTAPAEVVRKISYEPVAAPAAPAETAPTPPISNNDALAQREQEAIEDLLATNDMARELPTQANIVKLNIAVAEAEDFAREVMAEQQALGRPTEKIAAAIKTCLDARLAQARRRR